MDLRGISFIIFYKQLISDNFFYINLVIII